MLRSHLAASVGWHSRGGAPSLCGFNAAVNLVQSCEGGAALRTMLVEASSAPVMRPNRRGYDEGGVRRARARSGLKACAYGLGRGAEAETAAALIQAPLGVPVLLTTKADRLPQGCERAGGADQGRDGRGPVLGRDLRLSSEAGRPDQAAVVGRQGVVPMIKALEQGVFH